MSGFSSPQPFQNYPSDEEFSSLSFSSSSREEFHSLHPIDEADDFYDPFSDLSLFLSKKIKREIQETGTTRKWSGKIESNLLAKILPEFKRQFPKYRLGSAALKKVWEKVSYYYDKIQAHKGAIGTDGRLNLSLMIRENLKSTLQQTPQLNLPPYHAAHQVAAKISECIATLEGRRPDLNHLTKMIWALQKNMLKNLSAVNAKIPHEVYEKLDKLIVKALLEACAETPHISLKKLKQQILETLHLYGSITPLAKANQLTSTLSMLLARKFYNSSLIACHLAIPEKKALESFIDLQIKLSSSNQVLTQDNHYIELVQRILALYSIAMELPKNLSEETLKYAIYATYTKEVPYEIDGTLFVFINAEMHLISEDKSFESYEELERQIIEAYFQVVKLPDLNSDLKESFELLIWKKIEEEKNSLESLAENTRKLLERELANVLIDKPTQSFRHIIQGTLQFFKMVQKLPFHEKQNGAFWKDVKKKTEVWALQNEMLCRWIHFDERSPLFVFFKEEKKYSESLEELVTKVLQKFPLLHPVKKDVQTRLWILDQYVWYNAFSECPESSYDRFLKGQKKKLQNIHPEFSEKELSEKVYQISEEMLPLIPLPTEQII